MTNPVVGLGDVGTNTLTVRFPIILKTMSGVSQTTIPTVFREERGYAISAIFSNVGVLGLRNGVYHFFNSSVYNPNKWDFM